MQNPPQYAIASVDNALRLLIRVRRDGVLRLIDAAAELGVAKSTAHRLLAMLAYRGFVVQAPDRTYRIGPALSPEHAWADTGRLAELARPHLEALCSNVSETVHLMVRDGAEVRFVASVEAGQALRVTSRRDKVMPARLTSGGLALLARLTPEEVQRLHPQFPAGSGELSRLLSQLSTTRRAGYGLNFEASEIGVTAIGVALGTREGQLDAAVSVAAPTARLRKTQILAVLPELRACRQRIDRALARPGGH